MDNERPFPEDSNTMSRPDPSNPSPRSATHALLDRAKSGDRVALDRLFARYVGLLQRWGHRGVPHWARDAADTGDLVQETVLHTLKNLHSFESQGDGALRRYLRRSLLNRVRDQFRHAA